MIRQMFTRVIGFCIFLLTCVGAAGQAAGPDDLQEKFIQYQLHSLQEKIFVHTDKTFYLAGETIWFKIYNVDESFNKPANISKVAYVEIISADHKPVMQAKIALDNGTGNGSFIIPSSMVSGTYKLRSYTSRMRNFGADYYFEQPLTFVNTFKTLPPARSTPAGYQVDFFPEGGNLVHGIRSVVAFKITDQYGNGIHAEGYILNEKKDTLGPIQTLRFGMGSFSLLPLSGAAYQAVLRIDDTTTIIKKLPPAYNQGYVMSLGDNASADLLKVTITASSEFIDLPVYLFVHTRHLVKEVMAARLHNNTAVFDLSKKKLGEGVSHMTVFNADRQPVCERIYFKRPSGKLVIQVKADQPVYGSRSVINVGLQTADQSGRAVPANMSMAVFMIDSLQPLKHEDIHAWLMLQSELAGHIESPGYYFNDSSHAAREALNNLMLTQGWRRFKWEDILKNRLPAFTFITEQEGPVISGILTDKITGLPQNNIVATVTVPGENFELRSAVSRQDGSIRFIVNDFYSSNDIIVQTVNGADSLVKVNIAGPFSDKFSFLPFPRFSLPEKWKDQILYRSINAQADNVYLIEKKKHAFAGPVADTSVFYGKADKQYYLDDYTRFITMEEVMKEFVIDVRVRKQAGRFQFRVVNAAYKSFFDQDPLVLIDGIPVTNVDKIMAFDPLKIKKIDVSTHRHYLGPLICDGIVSYRTYGGDLAGYELDPHAIAIEYEGLQRQREFYSPVYETPLQRESRIPDLRNLLYWSPDIKTFEDGRQQLSFYTSDIKGHFAVVVQGVTTEGLSGSIVTTFIAGK